MKTRILIVDDHTVYRSTLRTMINMQHDMEVVGEAENGLCAIAEARRVLPDIILMDAKMPIMNGVEASRLILAERPGIKILALTIYADDKFKADMMRAGVSAYILKGEDFVELCDTIRRAAYDL